MFNNYLNSILYNTLNSQPKNILDMLTFIKEKKFIQRPEQVKRVFIFGLGSSYFAAKLIGLTFEKMLAQVGQLTVEVHVFQSQAIEKARNLKPLPSDLVIALSHRGKSRPTLNALSLWEQAKAQCFLVAAKGVRYSGVKANISVVATVEEEKIEPHTIAVTSAIAAASMLLAEVLNNASVVREQVFLFWKEWAEYTPFVSFEKLLNDTVNAPKFVLGEFEGEVLAREAALKLMEMAKLPVRVFGSEEYFHGPRFSAKKDDSYWLIRHAEDFRFHLDERIKSEALIGKPSVEFELKEFLEESVKREIKETLNWVYQLTQIQWSCFAVAVNLGVNSDLIGKQGEV